MLQMVERDWNENRRDCRNLLMLGVCLENAIGAGKGPELVYTTPERLTLVKLSHPEVIRRLEDLEESGVAKECFCLNTCNRFEVTLSYNGDKDYVERWLAELFFRAIPESRNELNRLEGSEVVHHILRTSVGLNSGLPGETDIEGQLESALSLATKIEVLGEEASEWFSSIVRTARQRRAETGWSDFTPNYCQAALESVFAKADPIDLENGNVVIVGSSNTSRTCVEVLENHFGLDHEKITVYHRCHRADGQMKSIRRTTNGCKRQRVEDYNSPVVGQAVADAVLTIFGIDHDKPVLAREELRAYRNGNGKNSVVVDFNTFGSTKKVDEIEGVRLFPAQELERGVRDYARRMVDNPDFLKAAMEIEELLEKQVAKFVGTPRRQECVQVC